MRDKERIVEDVYEGQVEEGRGCLWGQGGEGVFMRDEWRRVEGVYEGQGKEGGGCLWWTREREDVYEGQEEGIGCL